MSVETYQECPDCGDAYLIRNPDGSLNCPVCGGEK